MNTFTLLAVGFTAGFLATVIPLYYFRKLLARHLREATTLAQTTRELENRRVAYDSGRDTLARSDGGRPGKVHDGLEVRPGTYAKYQRDNYR